MLGKGHPLSSKAWAVHSVQKHEIHPLTNALATVAAIKATKGRASAQCVNKVTMYEQPLAGGKGPTTSMCM